MCDRLGSAVLTLCCGVRAAKRRSRRYGADARPNNEAVESCRLMSRAQNNGSVSFQRFAKNGGTQTATSTCRASSNEIIPSHHVVSFHYPAKEASSLSNAVKTTMGIPACQSSADLPCTATIDINGAGSMPASPQMPETARA